MLSLQGGCFKATVKIGKSNIEFCAAFWDLEACMVRIEAEMGRIISRCLWQSSFPIIESLVERRKVEAYRQQEIFHTSASFCHGARSSMKQKTTSYVHLIPSRFSTMSNGYSLTMKKLPPGSYRSLEGLPVLEMSSENSRIELWCSQVISTPEDPYYKRKLTTSSLLRILTSLS